MQNIRTIRSCFILFLFVLVSCKGQTDKLNDNCPLIPKPLSLDVQPGEFTFGDSVVIELKTDEEIKRAANFLKNFVEQTGSCKAQIGTGQEARNKIVFTVCDTIAHDEAYRLDVSPRTITIASKGGAGAFYAVQTLRQLLPAECEKKICDENVILQVPCVNIYDEPRFKHRGFMLDVARHYFPLDFIKKNIDIMTLYKLNVLHLHLTDDQGWRIEIKSHPRLTSVGAWRKQSIAGHKNDVPRKYDGKPHGGYYTQDELREIVEYARERFIEVIPEIEMPGHASAAIAAYPQLGTEKQSIKVPTRFGVQYHAYNVADPKVIQFIKDVLDEICNLFPSETIHIGGDEVKYDQWKKSVQVRNFMKEQNIKTPADLQIWFTNTISHYLESKKKHMMGWNEITGVKIHDYTDFEDAASGASLAEGTIVHFWRGDPSLIKQTVKKGYQVVNSYHEYTYLDYDTAYTSLEKAYHFDPLAGITGKETDLIIGIGAQMWGEWIPTPSDMYRKLYPRIAAFAECGWTSPSNKSWKRFNQAAYKENLRWKQLYQ